MIIFYSLDLRSPSNLRKISGDEMIIFYSLDLRSPSKNSQIYERYPEGPVVLNEIVQFVPYLFDGRFYEKYW